MQVRFVGVERALAFQDPFDHDGDRIGDRQRQDEQRGDRGDDASCFLTHFDSEEGEDEAEGHTAGVAHEEFGRKPVEAQECSKGSDKGNTDQHQFKLAVEPGEHPEGAEGDERGAAGKAVEAVDHIDRVNHAKHAEDGNDIGEKACRYDTQTNQVAEGVQDRTSQGHDGDGCGDLDDKTDFEVQVVAVVERTDGADHEHGDDEAEILHHRNKNEHRDHHGGDHADTANKRFGYRVNFTDAVRVVDEAELFGVYRQEEDHSVGDGQGDEIDAQILPERDDCCLLGVVTVAGEERAARRERQERDGG